MKRTNTNEMFTGGDNREERAKRARMRPMRGRKGRLLRQNKRTGVLPMLEAEVRLQRGRRKQEEEESGSGNATTKGRTM